jgi:hypothetical protein
MSEHIVTLPTFIQVSNKTRFSINLNQYRNSHFQILNKAKVLFLEQVRDQIQALPHFKRLAISYTIYPRTRQLCDVSNICSIADKFFCDAMKELGRIDDDNYQVVLGTQYLFGEVDPQNPRIEARLHNHD